MSTMSTNLPLAFTPGWTITTDTSKPKSLTRSRREPASFARLPLDIQNNISQSLTAEEMKPLITVCRSWQVLAEERVWETVSMDPRSLSYTRIYNWGDPVDNEEEAHAWRELMLANTWSRLAEALEARPARARHIRSLTMYPVECASADLTKVLDAIAGSVTYVHLGHACCKNHLCRNANIGCYILDTTRSLPKLESLKIAVGVDWMVVLSGPLHSSPNLVSLEVVANPGTPKCCGDFVLQRVLPKLEKVILRCPDALHAAEHIIKLAPNLQEMETYTIPIGMAIDEHECVCDDEVNHESNQRCLCSEQRERRNKQPNLTRHVCPSFALCYRNKTDDPYALGVRAQAVLASKSLRHVTIYGESIYALTPRPAYAGIADADQDPWLLNTETLAFESIWNQQVPPHKTLRALLLQSPTTYPYAFIGTKPTTSDTGIIARWVIDYIEASKQLALIVPRRPSQRNLPAQWWAKPNLGLAIRTYKSRGRFAFLHRIRCRPSVANALLLDGPVAHHQDFLAQSQLYIPNVANDVAKVAEPEESEVDIETEPMMDLTYYGNRALPKSVLRQIYDSGDLDFDWVEGQRETLLDEDGWSVLNAWLETVDM